MPLRHHGYPKVFMSTQTGTARNWTMHNVWSDVVAVKRTEILTVYIDNPSQAQIHPEHYSSLFLLIPPYSSLFPLIPPVP